MNNKFNRDLLTVTVLVSLVVIVRLFVTANEVENWRGFTYSALHVLFVAGGTCIALWSKNPAN